MLPILGVAVALAVCEAAAVLTSTVGLCTRHWRPHRRPKKLDGDDLGLPPRPNENNTVKSVPVQTIPVKTVPVTGSQKVFGEIGGGASGGGGGGKGGNAADGGVGGGGKGGNAAAGGVGGGEIPACHGGDHGYHGGGYGHGYGGGGWGDSGGDGGGGGGWD